MGWKRRQKPKIKIGCSEIRDIFYLWTLKVFSMYFDPKTLTMTVSITATMAVDASFETNDAVGVLNTPKPLNNLSSAASSDCFLSIICVWQVRVSVVVCTRDFCNMAAHQRRNDATGSSRISSSEFVEFVRICENDWRLRPYLTMKGALVAVELDKFIEKGLKTTRQSTRQELTCLNERFRRRRSYSWIAGYRNPYSVTDVRITRNQLIILYTVV
jgi:hypothetical protein